MSKWDNCFKIYYPVKGNAELELTDSKITLEKGKIYFINGYKMIRQTCPCAMDVYWIHFIPSSLILKYILMKSTSVYSMNTNESEMVSNAFSKVEELFNLPNRERNRLSDARPYDTDVMIRGAIVLLTGKVLQKINIENFINDNNLLKLKDSVDFMDKEYINNPSLSEIASIANYSDIYFHRLFCKTFGVTPHQYMLNKRMEKALQLINENTLNIKQIAIECGYDSEFYFSRVFKNHFGTSPMGYLKIIRNS